MPLSLFRGGDGGGDASSSPSLSGLKGRTKAGVGWAVLAGGDDGGSSPTPAPVSGSKGRTKTGVGGGAVAAVGAAAGGAAGGVSGAAAAVTLRSSISRCSGSSISLA